jgi:hypothetical protein
MTTGGVGCTPDAALPMKHPSSVKKGQAVQCVNCRNEINLGAMVCPYGHANPILFGAEPYDGLKHINEPSPYDPEMTLGVLGAVFLSVLPPVGVLWGMAGLSLASKWFKSRKQQ